MDERSAPANGNVSTLNVIEENLKVHRQKEEIGKVRAVKQVHEEDVLLYLPVSNEEVIVERIPINEYVETAPKARHEGETMIIPVMKEELVVQTRLVLVEEIRITRRREERMVEQHVTLRREEVSIERSSDRIHNPDKEK